jgi:hypothetical protein
MDRRRRSFPRELGVFTKNVEVYENTDVRRHDVVT